LSRGKRVLYPPLKRERGDRIIRTLREEKRKRHFLTKEGGGEKILPLRKEERRGKRKLLKKRKSPYHEYAIATTSAQGEGGKSKRRLLNSIITKGKKQGI